MTQSPLKLGLALGSIAFAVLLAGAAGWLIGYRHAFPGTARGQPAPAEPVIGQAPSYTGLTNQLGRPVDSTQFRGQVRLVTFQFAYCRTYCPLIAAHLTDFEHTLADAHLRDRVQLVSFNVDPEGTGPPQMRAFLREYGWDPHDLHWQYLTGTPQTIRRVVRQGYHIAYRKVPEDDEPEAAGASSRLEIANPLAERVAPGYDITHNDALIVVDPQGRIRKVFSQADRLSAQRLLKAIRPLLPGSSA